MVLMNIIQSQPKKEVMAVDADDHLCRPLLIRFNFSEMRLSRLQVNYVPTRVTLLFARHG
jgi:hypothetical protein